MPTSDEDKTLLLSCLNAQRDHVLGILDGLSDEAMHRPMLPSAWTCAGLVHHLTLDDERFWFSTIMAGQGENETEENRESAWIVPTDISAEALLAGYRDEIARANAIIERTPLEAPPGWWPEDQWPGWRLKDLREVILHVITETACHAGHADAARELIDGRRWMVLE